MAFEAIVKRQIEKLRSPAIKCVDMVMNELSSVLKKCADKVSIYTYFKKRCRGERMLHDRNELWVPFGMQNFTSCVAHAYSCVASENQALQLVYPFSSMGNATSEILHTKCTHSSFRSCNLRSPRQRFLK